MSRFFTSLLALLLRGAPARESGRTTGRARRYLVRALEGAAARAIEVTVRPRAQARQPRFAWRGEVTFRANNMHITVPGTWALEWQAAEIDAGSAAGNINATPLLTDHAAWAAHMKRVVMLQEPGTQLRVQQTMANGWHTLEVRVPTRPTTIVEFDRDALCQLLGNDDTRLELRAFT
jgi:hypothetical protein